LCALELEGLDLIGNSSKGGVDKLATLLPWPWLEKNN
jgi:hypothetical protein